MNNPPLLPLWLGITKFTIVAFCVPLIYAVVNGCLRRLMSGEKKAENTYLGVDITLAAFVSVCLYALEPQSRILPQMKWETADIIKTKSEYGLGCAIAIDFLCLAWSMCIHSDYLQFRSKVPQPTSWHKVTTCMQNLIWNNLLGFIAFAASAMLLRV